MSTPNLLKIYHDREIHGVYYSVGQRRFINKLLALDHARLTHQFPKFHYHDEAFGGCDWQQDPQQSWTDLLTARATQIRQTYDYVMMGWSGGTDSMTMWNAFRRAGARIDSILVVYAEPDRHSGSAYPKANAEWIATNHWDPHTEIIVSERTDPKHFSEFTSPDWIWQDTGLANAARIDGGINKELHRKLLEDRAGGRSCCFVVGHEKPCVRLDKGLWWSSFLDTKAYNYFAGYQYFEPFFSTPGLPELHIKQSHMVKAWAKQHIMQRGLVLDQWDSESDWHVLGDFDDQARACGRDPEILPGTSEQQKKVLRAMESLDIEFAGHEYHLHGHDWFYLSRALEDHVPGARNYAQAVLDLSNHKSLFEYLMCQGWLPKGKKSLPWTSGIHSKKYLLGA